MAQGMAVLVILHLSTQHRHAQAAPTMNDRKCQTGSRCRKELGADSFRRVCSPLPRTSMLALEEGWEELVEEREVLGWVQVRQRCLGRRAAPDRSCIKQAAFSATAALWPWGLPGTVHSWRWPQPKQMKLAPGHSTVEAG